MISKSTFKCSNTQFFAETPRFGFNTSLFPVGILSKFFHGRGDCFTQHVVRTIESGQRPKETKNAGSTMDEHVLVRKWSKLHEELLLGAPGIFPGRSFHFLLVCFFWCT